MTGTGQYTLFIGSRRSSVSSPEQTEYCGTIYDAIERLRHQHYQAIYVVYGELPEPKADALNALLQLASNAQVFLLIDMQEEPAVLELKNQPGQQLFTDYLLFDWPRHTPVPMPDLTPHAGHKLTDLAKDQYIRELEQLVTQDDLTGLKNRRYLRQFLPTILKYAAKQNCQVTLLLFDLDDFKHYNDTYGHAVGDRVLVQTARLIRQCCRDHDVVARLGGDEFAVVFWDTCDGQSAEEIAERRTQNQHHPRQAQFMAQRFRKQISETAFEFLGPQGQGTLTISGGLSSFPVDGITAEELFEKADQAMLEAKRSGKNQIEIVGQPSA
ncbi:MAG: GGDEF domain-containing protein [Planctomycetota bacterium]|jgi:diguanylate cyclase (GGDEF)-like protein